MRAARTAAAAVLVAALGLGVAACSGGDPGKDRNENAAAPRRTTTSAEATPDPQVYVAVGASETVGVGADDPATQAWPVVLHRKALPETRFVDVGVSGATVRDALAGQLPRALAADPDVVTVWLAVNDALTLMPVATYEAELGRLVHALRQGGRTEVLLGNVPPLELLPAYRTCLPHSNVATVPCALPVVPSPAQVRATVDEFNAAIARVAKREGAVLVDLSGERDLAGLTSDDGFHPSTKGHREVAKAFAAALEAN